MAEELVMPRLSDTMERGTIARWLVHEGDAVHEGDVLAEIETDKATMELQRLLRGRAAAHPRAGRRERRPRRPDRAWSAPRARMPRASRRRRRRSEAAAAADGAGGGGEDAGASATADGGRREAAEAEAERRGGRPQRERRSRAPARATPGSGDLKASPVARRMASDAGFDLRALAGKGSGPDGRIVRVDVERADRRRRAGRGGRRAGRRGRRRPRRERAAPGAPRREADEVIEPSPMLRAVARRMSESKSQVPHFYLQCEIDMGKALALREELNAELADEGVKLTVNDLIVRACALALRDHPQFHRSWVDGKLATSTARRTSASRSRSTRA